MAKVMLTEDALHDMVESLNHNFPGIKEILFVKKDRIKLGEHIELFVRVDDFIAEDSIPTMPTSTIKPPDLNAAEQAAKKLEAQTQVQKQKDNAKSIVTAAKIGASAGAAKTTNPVLAKANQQKVVGALKNLMGKTPVAGQQAQVIATQINKPGI